MSRWIVMVIVSCVSALILIGGAPAFAQGVPEIPQLRVLGPRDGLPSTTVNVIDVDADGFVWAGTTDGLARYDGYGFRVWRHDPSDPNSLPGNIVQAVHVDQRDRVWVATEFSGIGMLDAHRDRMFKLRRETHPALGSNDVFAFASEGDTLWIGTATSGVYRVEVKGDDAADWVIERLPDLPSMTVLSLARDTAGRLWIGTATGLSMWDGKQMQADALALPAPVGMVFSVLVDGDRVWIGSGTGVYRREADGHWGALPWSPMFERPNAVVAMVKGSEGGNAVWIGSQRRLWRASNDHDIPLPLAQTPGVLPRLVAGLRMQADGGLWVSVPGSGIGYLRPDWRSIAEITRSLDGGGLAGQVYRAVAPARDGGVWVASTEGHIERIDASGVVERLSGELSKAIQGTRTLGLLEDSLGQLWLGQGNRGLARISVDGRLDRWLLDTPDDASLSAGLIDHVVAGRAGTLWLSVQGKGLQQRELASGRVIRNLAVDADNGLGDGDSEALMLGPDGRLWVAASFGLGWLDEAAGKMVVPPGLAGDRVFGFDFDGADTLWLHRLNGLEQFRRKDGRWTRVATVPAGRDLPAVESGALRVDQARRVWLSTQRGLFRWDPVQGHLRTYGLANGLTSQEFIDRAMTLTDQGMLAVASAAGSIVLVDTRYPDPAARKVKLRIDGIDVRQNGRWLTRSATDGLVFGPDDREIRLGGHLLAFDDPTGTRYWSLLEGFDRDWVDQGAEGNRIFTGLMPGKYRLRMRATDAAGNEADEQQLLFSVKPAWWRSHLALLLYGALGLGALASVVSSWRGRVRRRHEWQLAEQQRRLAEQASEAKTRFLATLGHEIRTPMTGVLGMAELLKSSDLDARQRGQVDAIHGAGRHLLRLVNDALDLARIEAGKLVLVEAPVNMRALVADVIALMQPIAEQKGLGFAAQLADDAPRWLLGDGTRIEQILLNLLGNAIKFTEHGEVGMRVEALAPHGLRVEIHDTGPGLNDEQRSRLFRRFEQAEGARTSSRYGGSGLGLAISQELAAAMAGRIEVESSPGKGSRFRVDLPLPASAPAAVPTPLQPAVDRPLKLLLVEDDVTVAEVVSGLLQARGHQVRHAAHGLAALSEVATARFDLGLLDLDLPGMDGFELARQLRGQGLTMPLLAVTARADADVEAQATAAGFDAFIRKPVTSAMLAEAIDAVMPPA
ncbi:MAG: ATP-binding protein [Pseudomonadota bacterium]|nr:ATP-binding protein [Pseudomonadota bacterium]